MRLWSLGQQRCITTYRIHGEGVWALCANDNFTGFYSSGRDKHVMWTDLSLDDSSTLLFVEDAPVLKVSIAKVTCKSNKNRDGGSQKYIPQVCKFLKELPNCVMMINLSLLYNSTKCLHSVMCLLLSHCKCRKAIVNFLFVHIFWDFISSCEL